MFIFVSAFGTRGGCDADRRGLGSVAHTARVRCRRDACRPCPRTGPTGSVGRKERGRKEEGSTRTSAHDQSSGRRHSATYQHRHRRDIELFTEITGDRNPIHYDDELAARSRFGGIVVQGGVTSGLLNALVAEQLPSGQRLPRGHDGDRATWSPRGITVRRARDDKPVTTLATSVTNQDGVVVLDGTAVVWRDPTTRRGDAPSTFGRPGSGRSAHDGSAQPTTSPEIRHSHRRMTTMTITTEKPPLNGVDTATLFATLDAVKGQNEIAKFQFRATNTWVTGTHSRSTFSGFYGAMQEMQHEHETVLDSDHPAVLVGTDHAPTPVEYLLHAIAACLTAGIANIAAARGVRAAPRSPRPSRATSTCSASSACPTAPSATATSRSRSPSTSRATPTTRPCAASSSSPAAARPSTTR